ncbi:MAG: ParA family protein, partial [Mycobacterium leprae]
RIGVVNVKGGVGKTTTAVYLAALLQEAGPVLLIDADPQATAAEWLEEAPLSGVQVVEAPSERLLSRAVELGDGATIIIDTPPGIERLVRVAIGNSEAIVIPTRVGGVEISRVQATISMLPPALPRGLVLIAGRTRTRDYRETLRGWQDAGVPLWGSIPERVGIASGPDAPLHPDGLAAYEQVAHCLLNAPVA